MRRLPLFLCLSCSVSEPSTPAAIDLVSPLGQGEARAGVLTQEEALVGGPAGESRLGDVMLKNAVARFVIQGVRDGGGIANQAGSLIDADIVRSSGQPDSDLVTDWMVMVDVGHLPRAESVEVIDDGLESGVAVVRVKGHESYLDYLAGALENHNVDDYGLDFITDYTLRADSPLLEVKTTVTLKGDARRLEPGDVLMDVAGIGELFVPGVGRVDSAPSKTDWLGYVDSEDRVAVGMFSSAPDMGAHPNMGLEIVNFLLSVSSLYMPAVELETGASTTWTRWWGVGPDLATLTDAWLPAAGVTTRPASVTVSAEDGPVAGARVTALVDGAPWTMGFTDANGVFAAAVPATGAVRFVADGSGSRVVRDLPDGSADYGPLSGPAAQKVTLDALASGAVQGVIARGRGRAEADEGETIALGVPGTIHIAVPDGGAFEARVRRTDAEVVKDALGVPPIDGLAALVYARQGSIDVPIEPGEYDVIVQRGARFEVHTEHVTVTSGATATLDADDLTAAWSAPGWFGADTHVHSAPSSDGKLTLADRALTMAGTGVQLWFGTEHDSVADEQPVVAALGLDEVLRAVTSVEVSPVVRGHANVFPVVSNPDLPNGGAWRWWLDPVSTTTEHFTKVRANHPGALVQINHPFSPGMPSLAGWEPGRVDRGDLWYDGFDLLEVVKGNRDDLSVSLYLDLISRGILVAPMGNTDSHGFVDNDPGLNLTWIEVLDDAGQPVTAVSDISDAQLVAALKARRTVASNGPFVDLSIAPGSVITAPTTLDVVARAPSWMRVDRLTLLRDGSPVETVDGDSAVFSLDADADASFVVTAEGDTEMSPLGGHRPYAITSAILLDVDGDGWTPPLPPLELGP